MWREMLQPLQFCFDIGFTYRSTALPENWVPNQNWAQVKPTKLLFKKESDYESCLLGYWGEIILICPVMISPLSATTQKYRQAFDIYTWVSHTNQTRHKNPQKMNIIQHKTTNMIEILKLDTETDVSVLPLLSCSASCLMGKVTASVPYSHSYLFCDCH